MAKENGEKAFLLTGMRTATTAEGSAEYGSRNSIRGGMDALSSGNKRDFHWASVIIYLRK